MRNRNAGKKKVIRHGSACRAAGLRLLLFPILPHSSAQVLGLLFVSSWLVLSISTGLDSELHLRNGGLSIACCLAGAVLIIASMKILWANRKMGDTWEQKGEPNPDFVVYNLVSLISLSMAFPTPMPLAIRSGQRISVSMHVS